MMGVFVLQLVVARGILRRRRGECKFLKSTASLISGLYVSSNIVASILASAESGAHDPVSAALPGAAVFYLSM